MDSRFGMMAPIAALLRSRWVWLVAVLLAYSAPALLATNLTHWAFQPLTRPSVPANKFSNKIDAFVSSALATNGRMPVAEADRRTLIRRLSFDLRGLPPSPEEVVAFLKDTRADAFERRSR